MHRTLTPLVFAFGSSSLLLMDSAIKGSVILLGAACLAVILKRDSAALRHLVWLVAIVAMLFIPVLSVMLPRWQVLPTWATISQSSPAIEKPIRSVELPSPFKAPTIVSPENFISGEFDSQSNTIDNSFDSANPTQSRLGATKNDVGIDRSPSDPSWNWISILPFLWSIGFGALILRLMAARWMLGSNEQRAAVIAVFGCPDDARNPIQHESDAAIATAFENAYRQLGIRKRVQLLIDSERTIPVVWGIFWFRLTLPESARQWSSDQLRSVLLHELAHIKRRDTIVQLLAQFACALHWFNPLVWFAAWRLHVERERACDDLVLAQGVRASAYAEHLLNVATKLTVARWTSACGLAMASHSPLESRLHAILSDRLNRRKVSTAIGMMGLLLGAGVAIPIAMLRAADDDWNPPSGAHIGSNEFSAFCIHDGKEATFVIAYQGDFDSASQSSSNAKARKWTDSVTLTAKQPGIALTFHRTHVAPDKLRITTVPAEGRDLSKPAPPREFGQKEYDLANGRVFLLSDKGSVRQLDIATPMVTDNESAMKLSALIAAIPPQERNDSAFMTNFTVQLSPETIAKLKWGEPVNGLRMALAYPPALGDALLGKKAHFELVVQNVTEKEIHFLASDEAPNPRRLLIREGERIVQGLSDPTVSPADWKLQPGHCGVIRLYTNEERDKAGTIPSAGIESDLSKLGRYHAIVQMEIVKAPAGAWTGKLVTGQTRGSADVVAAPAPMHKDAKALYEVWQRYARANGDIPGALVGELAAAVKQFIKYNPTWETVPKLNELLPRLDATHDWKPADAIALLDEVAGIQDSPLSPAPWKGSRDRIRQGDALPEKYADVPWGEEQPSGLRAAWVLEPSAAEHRIGTALKARLLVQNRGQVPVMLQVPTWHQGWVKASDASGKDVEASGLEWTTMAMLNTVRLEPGAYIEINTPGVGIGPRAGMGPWAGPRVGSNVLAKPGDELTLTHGLVPLDGSEVGISEDDPHVSGPSWWLAHIKTRLNRELPLPSDAAERTRMLDRSVRELFATAPTAEETEAFIADKTPDALDALAKRLVARVDVVSFSGKLPTAPVKFRVLDADATADKQPRVVLGPGEYPLPCTTGDRGNATLKIVGRPVGDRRTNDAQLIFEATEFTGLLPPDPHKLEIPDGWGTWAIVCRPNDGYFYLLHNGTVRKIDYSKPRNVTDTPANGLSAEFHDEVKRQLDIAGVSAVQQAEIFEKPAAPAAVPDLTTNADVPAKPAGAIKLVKLTPDALLGFWRGKMDDKDLMLSFHRPPVEKDVQLDIYEGKATIGALAKFTISPDGGSALVTSNRADSAAFGTLHPIDANTMRLERVDGEGKAAILVILTRDAEAAATEPRQAEAREIFDMWKRTANADGTIPGTFIGQLAAEVRTYVRANPTLDSAAKLPKLLPRFVTSRDWTQAEAIKLLDDVAYYATEPIAARVAKAKLPSGPLWRTETSGVPVDELAGEGVMWNEVQNGLSLGYRITGDEWRIHGKDVKVELLVQNHGDKDVKFQDNMRADPEFGLRVKLTDAKGEDHNSNFWPDDRPPFGFHRLLPPGHALKVKEFTISLFLPENDFSHAKGHFFGINPGAYNFHCELELPGFSATGEGGKQLTPAAGEWTGKLTTRGLNVEVIAPDAPAPTPRIESTQDGEQPIKTIPVTSKELSGIWYGATDRTGVVVRFIGRESRIKDTQGTVSGEWVVHVVDGSIGAALEFTDDPKAGVVRIAAGMWDDKAKEAFTMSLGSIERGEDDTLHLTINDNPREPMYLATKRIPLTFIDERDQIQRSDVEKMQSLMRTLQQKKQNSVSE